MTSKGCAKAWGSTWSDWIGNHADRALHYLKNKLERRLGIELEAPCSSVFQGLLNYCEICPKTDSSRIHCPISAHVSHKEISEHYITANISAHEDYSAYQCPDYRNGDKQMDYSYWPMYDDGSICDCGSPFIVEIGNYTEKIQNIKFRRPRENEAKQNLFLASSLQSTRCSGNVNGERWSRASNDTCVRGMFFDGYFNRLDDFSVSETDVTLPPSIPAPRCNSRPDISSMFETTYFNYNFLNPYLNSQTRGKIIINGKPIEEKLIEEELIEEELFDELIEEIIE